MSVLPEKILVATDGSEQATRATRTAAEPAGKLGAELHVMHVGEPPVIFHPEMRGDTGRGRGDRRGYGSGRNPGWAVSREPSWAAYPTPWCITRTARCSSCGRKWSSVTLRCISPVRTDN